MAALSQEILVTPLPGGLMPDGRLRLALHFAPRLVSTPGRDTLQRFPDWVRWPEIAAALKAELVLGSGASVPLEPAFGDDAPDRALWAALFPPDTWVRPQGFDDLAGRRIRSFPTSALIAAAAGLYGSALADTSGELPPPEPLEQMLSPLIRLLGRTGPQALDKQVDEWLSKGGALPPVTQPPSVFQGALDYAFYQSNRFYRRPQLPGNAYRERPYPSFVHQRPEVPRLDFHQGVAGVADHPRLQRRLGLVLVFSCARPRGMAATGELSVKLHWPAGAPRAGLHVPRDPAWTRYRLSAQHFLPRSAEGSALLDGYLSLRGASEEPMNEKTRREFSLLQFDVDGTAIKTLDLAGVLAGRHRHANYRSAQRYGLPVLRTSGLAVVRHGRDQRVHQRLLAASALNQDLTAGNKLQLWADDVLRGWRLDVLDLDAKDPQWRSLCLARAQYLVGRGTQALKLQLDDEGYVKSASASSDEVSTDLYLHERMLAFEGWSLVAPRPGRTLATDPTAPPEVPAERGEQLPLSTLMRPLPGSLPRLRFGHRYRLRLRAVDLAGQSLPPGDRDDTHASEMLTYARYEPVASPVVVPAAPYGEGESLEHLVIRSDFDRSAAAYATDPEVTAALAGAAHGYTDDCTRHLAPPKVSQAEAELHGRFDDFIGPGGDRARGFHLAARENGTLFDTDIVDLASGARVPVPGADRRLFTPAGTVPTNLGALRPGDPLQPGEVLLRADEQLTVPYLPDPFARGVALRGLPGHSGVWLQPFRRDDDATDPWPDLRPFRLRIVERAAVMADCVQQPTGPAAPQWDEARRVLTVFLPKAAVAEVRFACYLHKEDWAQMGVQKWFQGAPAQRAALTKLVTTGGHWMVTPWRTLTLVHAVQRPLCPPRWGALLAGRATLGATDADLSGRAHLNAPSTGQLDLYARWAEPQDRVTDAGTWPSSTAHEGHVLQRRVDPLWPALVSLPAVGTAAPGDDGSPLKHEFGDTKHRRVRYRLKGTTRFREYLPPALMREDARLTREGPEIEVSVPASARPLAPQVVDIVPTFRWLQAPLNGGGVSRVRRGQGLRVYLQRGWFSSGEGELLGAVFAPQTLSDRMAPFVTLWGQDPMFDSQAPTATVSTQAFVRRVAAAQWLTLAETGPGEAHYAVAGHEVHHDPARDLLYSDLEIAAGRSYCPFVRLALARFQPEAIAHAHLSRVVQTDAVQLLPDRTLTVRPVAGRRHAVKLHGLAPRATHLSRLFEADQRLVPRTLAGAARSIPAEASQPGGPLHPGASAVPAFSKPGLNRYEVGVEYLPAGASPDFGWVPLPGVVQHPAGAPVLTLPRVPPLKTTTLPRRRIGQASAGAFSARVSEALGGVLQAGTARLPGTVTQMPQAIDLVELGPLLLGPPLWEADLAIPAAPANAPRRLVVEEYELHLQEADDRDPAKRRVVKRLVYADFVAL